MNLFFMRILAEGERAEVGKITASVTDRQKNSTGKTFMNNRRYSDFIFTLGLIGMVVIGYALVSSIDRTRFELEKLHTAVRELKDKVETQPLRTVQLPPRTGVPETGKTKPEFANAEFFDPKAVPGGRFITAIPSDTKNMNTLINNDATVSAIWGKAMDSLADRNYADLSKWEPKMAESWTPSPDGLKYRVKLRKGIYWHDFTDPVSKKVWKNVPVTAHDFKFYVDTVKNPEVDAAPLRTYMKDLERIDVISDTEFDVIWNRKYFLSLDMTLALQPLPRHLYHAYPGPFDPAKFNNDNERNRIIVGCGPYRFVKWDKGRRVLMTRFENYYGKRYGAAPALKDLSFDVIQHPNTRLQALISKDLDETDLQPDQWVNRTSVPAFGKNGWLKKVKHPMLAYNYLGFNLSNPIFKDAKTRVALSHLINRDRLIKDVYYNLARPVSGPFFPDGAAYDKSIAPYPYSVETAKKLLAEAGWKDIDNDGILERDGRKLNFTVMYPNASPTYQRMLAMIKEDMAKAGVKMELLGLEWSVCVQRLEKKSFDVCALAWTGGIKPDPFQLWHSSQAEIEGSSNHIRFKNPEADKLIEEIRVTFDPEKQKELYHKFHKLVHEEQPYIFLFSPYALKAVSSRYRNLRLFPLGFADDILWTSKEQQMRVPGF